MGIMREMLFRGKRKDNDEWVEGYYAKLTVCIDNSSEERAVIIPNDVPVSYSERASCFFVIPETISEYTGLCDENGKKIFEGDILQGAAKWLGEAKNGVVTFRDGAFGFVWYRGEVETFHPFTSVCNVIYEIIGNIHDNPELLKGGAEG